MQHINGRNVPQLTVTGISGIPR